MRIGTSYVSGISSRVLLQVYYVRSFHGFKPFCWLGTIFS